MNQFQRRSVQTAVRKELGDIVSTLQRGAASVGDALRRNHSIEGVTSTVTDPPTVDPLKFKHLLVTLLKVVVVIELIGAFREGVGGGGWGRFAIDLIIAGILFTLWERIMILVRGKKEEYRRRMESSTQKINLWDALLFSLLWSDEIYSDIPADRRRLVVIAFTLIVLGIVALYVSIGPSLMQLVVAGALVLGAVNLLAWVVSLERGEKESLQTELRLAHDVQVALMPTAHPSVPGFDIAGISLPAKEVGGDHFDYCWPANDGERFGISVFDVSGKGMQAAMSAVFTSGAFSSEVKGCTSPAEVLTHLNASVYTHTKRGQFVAFLLAVVDARERILTFANAGQMHPLLVSNGSLRWLQVQGVHFPLGMQENTVYEQHTYPLRAGDTLFLLTDGFTDAMNAESELFGNERLEQTILGLDVTRLRAEESLQAVAQAVKTFTGDVAQHDDMTMVVVKVL